MPHAILDLKQLSPEFYQRIGRVAAEWGWVEMVLHEMLAFFCKADPGSMYVITQSVGVSSVVGWLRILAGISLADHSTVQVISDLLKDIDEARAERNTVVHGTWTGHDDPTLALVQTFKWDRVEVAKTEVWDTADLDDLIAHIESLQLVLGNIGVKFGFLKLETDTGQEATKTGGPGKS
jgi:hypothetical protein